MNLQAHRHAMARYLPQRGRMVLLDALVSETSEAVTCQCTIDDDFIFLEGGAVGALATIEIAAQAAAVYVSIHAKTPVIGFLASCREARFDVESFAVGDILQVTATHVSGNERSGAFECVVRRGGAACATMHLILVDPGWSEHDAA
ncbi:MAG: hypothetical protein IPL79_11230 [Myxococcales bacterium]|nr:hypothetical protein [Myxococcales bacterium]